MTYAQRQVADIAATLPGATQVFRKHKIDFCCGGKVPLAEAVAAQGEPLSQIEAELAALETGGTEAPLTLPQLVSARLRAQGKNPAAPGEQAPPANPGQRNFGGPIRTVGAGGQSPVPRPPRPEPKIRTIPLDSIFMSDPYIYPDEKLRLPQRR